MDFSMFQVIHIFYTTLNIYLDLHHLQGVWNLPHKFHHYWIFNVLIFFHFIFFLSLFLSFHSFPFLSIPFTLSNIMLQNEHFLSRDKKSWLVVLSWGPLHHLCVSRYAEKWGILKAPPVNPRVYIYRYYNIDPKEGL